MPTYYVDPVNGNDAADGSTFALGGLPTVGPWLTVKSGATAARIAPGDTIKIAKSPAPASVGSCTFTHDQATVTIPSGIALKVDDGEAAWTASANVTCSAGSTYFVEGTKAAQHVIASGFTTGKVAYKALAGATDFSSYQQLSFWINTSAAVAAGVLQLCLCSDAAGATPVDTFNIPALGALGSVWTPITVNKGSALGSSIQSIALYAASDPGVVTVRTDWIMAVKAPGNDAISLRSLFSDTADEAGPWYPVLKIDGTTLTLGCGPNGAGCTGYFFGASGTKNGYKREGFDFVPLASSDGAVHTNESGTLASPYLYSGGWDTSSGLQTGYTWFTGYGLGYLVNASHGYVEVARICGAFLIAGYRGGAGAVQPHYLHDLAMAHVMSGISPYLCHLGRFEGIHIIGTENPIDSVSGNYVQCLFKDVYCWNASLNVVASAMVSDTKLIGCEFRRLEQKYNGTSYGMFQAAGECDVSLFDCLFEFSGPSDGSFNVMLANVGASLRFFRCLFGSANEISAGAAYPDRLVRSIEHQQTADNHKTWLPNGVTFDSEASVRHTASGIAWKASIDAAGAAKTSTWTPSRIPIAAVPCAASAQVTVSAWLRRTNAGLNAWLACPGGQIPGVDSDVTDELTAAVGTWEQQTISFTPSAAGVVQIELWMASSGAYSCYVDDMTIAQA